jgi:thiol-disulfide isomerase/thioredoxin
MANHDLAGEDRWVNERLTALEPATDWQPDVAAGLSAVHARQAAVTGRRRRAAVTAVFGAAVFVALPGTLAFGARCVEACVNLGTDVTQFFRADEPLATAPKAISAEIGGIAPEFIGTDGQGARLSLHSHRGRVVVLNFWATWCAPCRQEIPVLSALQARFGADGVDVIGVSLDEDGWAAITPFLSSARVSYPIALGNDDVAAAFGGVDALPATFVIDRDGVIHAKHVGAITAGLYDDLLTRLLLR